MPNGKIDAPGGPSSGLRESFGGLIRSSGAAMGGGARSAPLGVFKSPKRRVRAAHGRPREAKTH